MRLTLQAWAVCVALTAPGLIAPELTFAQAQYDTGGQYSAGDNLQAEAEQFLALANHARRIAGVGQLRWDPTLAAAALYHCRWMVQQGQIAHRYEGEPDLSQRAADSGARFGVIEENVAVGSTPAFIHDAWMKSPGHRANLLSPAVDSVGIAVIASRGLLYAVADFARNVPSLSAEQVEARVADLVRVSGIAIENDPTAARAACATQSGFPRNAAGVEPQYIERWLSASLDKLPQMLVDHLSSGRYRSAAIGSCPAQGRQGAFTGYRVAVMLY